MGIRPSELLGIDDPYEAYCLDEAVLSFGDGVRAELDKVKGKNQEQKRMMALRRMLGMKQKFADPAGLIGKKKSSG